MRPTGNLLSQGINASPWFIAVPHAASEDGFYEGFFIPKGELFLRASAQLIDLLLIVGALVSGNTWSVNCSKLL